MGYVRKNINDITPRSLQNLNDNFRILWLKVFGNIDTADISDEAITGRKIKAGSITADKIKAGELEVGKNVTMGTGARISWSQVDNIPELIDQAALNNMLGDLLNNSNLETILGEDYIITGKIYANQITAGTLTGFTIRTSASGERIEMAYDELNSYYEDGRQALQLRGGIIALYNASGSQYGQIYIEPSNRICLEDTSGAYIMNGGLDIDDDLSVGGDVDIDGTLNASNINMDNLDIYGGLSVEDTAYFNSSRVYFGDSGSYIEATSTGIRFKFDSNNYFVIEDGAAGVYVDGDYTAIA